MARKAIVAKCQKMLRRKESSIQNGFKMKGSTKVYNRCLKCGRPRGYLRDFGMCRICLRELANKGEVPGMRKSSW